MNYDKSTAEGQKRMFYESHDSVMESVHAKMARLSSEAGEKDKREGKPARLPRNDDYMAGYNSL